MFGTCGVYFFRSKFILFLGILLVKLKKVSDLNWNRLIESKYTQMKETGEDFLKNNTNLTQFKINDTLYLLNWN